MKRLLTYREQIILRETETWNRQQERRPFCSASFS